MSELQILPQSELPKSNLSHELEGYLHGGVGLSLILVDAEPGKGPSLHRHQYDELFIVQEGVATFVAGEVEREVKAGEIVIVPAGLPTASGTPATDRCARWTSTSASGSPPSGSSPSGSPTGCCRPGP